MIAREFSQPIYLCWLCAVLGVLIYAFSSNAKASEVGRILFWTGLIAFLFRLGAK